MLAAKEGKYKSEEGRLRRPNTEKQQDGSQIFELSKTNVPSFITHYSLSFSFFLSDYQLTLCACVHLFMWVGQCVSRAFVT